MDISEICIDTLYKYPDSQLLQWLFGFCVGFQSAESLLTKIFAIN